VTRLRARKIHQLIPPNGKVLEVGCGRGWLLKSLARLGHECHGTERSELAATGASRIVGIKIYTKPVEECGFATDQFDLIVLWHVLEHLDDPSQTLRTLNSLMKPGGWLLVEVPNYSSYQARLSGKHWFHLDTEHHLQHFTQPGLLHLLDRTGFSAVQLNTFNVEQCPYGVLQSSLNLIGLPSQQLYKILKREIIPPLSARLANYATATAFALPAAFFSLLETILKRGGVLRVLAKNARGS
jgi:SAM-dependent methyltransferase